jgi:hypothetical protein
MTHRVRKAALSMCRTTPWHCSTCGLLLNSAGEAEDWLGFRTATMASAVLAGGERAYSRATPTQGRQPKDAYSRATNGRRLLKG